MQSRLTLTVALVVSTCTAAAQPLPLPPCEGQTVSVVEPGDFYSILVPDDGAGLRLGVDARGRGTLTSDEKAVWAIEPLAGADADAYRIRDVASGRCLAVSARPPAGAVGAVCADVASQKWLLSPQSDTKLLIRTKGQGLALTRRAVNRRGPEIGLYAQSNSPQQIWYLRAQEKPRSIITTLPDRDRDGLADAYEDQLLAKYSPELRFSRDCFIGCKEENYPPTSVDYFIRMSDMKSEEDEDSASLLTNAELQDIGTVLTLQQPHGPSDITLQDTPGFADYYLNPLEHVPGVSQPQPGRFGEGWATAESRKNVGMYGHVVPMRLLCGDAYRPDRVLSGYDLGRRFVKVEYWQFFGYNLGRAGAASDHEGDWTTVHLVIDPQHSRIVSVLMYVHGEELRYDMTSTRETEQKEGGRMLEYRGYNCCQNIGSVELGWERAKAQNHRVRLVRDDSTADFTHPVVYVENNSHEFWPHEYWSWPSSPDHGGDSVHRYVAANVPNLGEVEHPLGGAEARVVLRFNGSWGTYQAPALGPTLHGQWTWPADSSIRWRLNGLGF